MLSLKNKDVRWALIWLVTTAIIAVWDIFFLNKPALKLVVTGFFNTFVIAFLVIIVTLVMGWMATLGLHYLQEGKHKTGYLLLNFFFNLVRSIPQVIGILLGYVAVGMCIQQGLVHSGFAIFALLSFCMGLFIFLEMADCMRERIDHYQKLDFYNAMRVCGVSQSRIINFNILWKNSRIHIFNKLISVMGIAVFLQCSVDFIISVGLSTQANQVTLPTTLGNLLANLDSKQDILAVGNTLTHPLYFPHLFFEHLQGLTVAFLIVFSLLCIHNIANGYAERHRL
jgi:ABC-type dipeptide/oligopeptide/nickel transport system permease subunit